MKKFAFACAVALALTVAAPHSAKAEGELLFYTWADYTNPELIKKFENDTGIKVIMDTFDSNDTLLAKMKLGGGEYDIVVPGEWLVKVLIDEDLLEKVEPNQLSNFNNIDPQWVDVYWDPGRHYSVPWHWGTTSFQINTDAYGGDIHTLSILFDPPEELKGRINMLKEVNEVMNMALRYLGLPLCNKNPDDMRKVQELLLKQKEWVKAYSSDPYELIVSGEVDVTMNWSGYSYRSREAKPSLAFAYPKEGLTVWMDNLVVPKGAKNRENALIFMNYMMDPQNIAMNSNYVIAFDGTTDGWKYMDPKYGEAQELKPPAGAEDRLQFSPLCDDEVAELYNKVWTNVLK